MMTMRHIWLCLLGPRLYKVHLEGPSDRLYVPRAAELWGDRMIVPLKFIWKYGMLASPLVAYYLYRKGHAEIESLIPVLKFVTGVGLVAAVSLCLRCYGRLLNPQYGEFLAQYARSEVQTDATWLRRYDFDFESWPVDFDCGKFPVEGRAELVAPPVPPPEGYSDAAMRLFAKLAVKTFGLSLIYPGSIGLLRAAVGPALLKGRIKLVEEHNGKRYKLKTRDGNSIDTMFVDRRGISLGGRTLVIACEGNAGFYEIGIMSTPVEAGFSALGWNHPGFAGSTGEPYPLQEQHAIDAVIEFAVRKLNFERKDIVLYGWSIGGYAAAWAAARYPDVGGVVLDATFDDLLPLALARMPPSWSPLVTRVVRDHVDLNVMEALKGYRGPVTIVRRVQDEIICLQEGKLFTNRGNDLLVKLLVDRYPQLFDEDQYLFLWKCLGHKESDWKNKFSDHNGDADKNRKILFLASKYLMDYDSSHTTALPPSYFRLPLEITLDDDFVFT